MECLHRVFILSIKLGCSQVTQLHETSSEKVTTDGLASYPRVIKEELGDEVRTSSSYCTSNPMEQSHRRVKYRYYPRIPIH